MIESSGPVSSESQCFKHYYLYFRMVLEIRQSLSRKLSSVEYPGKGIVQPSHVSTRIRQISSFHLLHMSSRFVNVRKRKQSAESADVINHSVSHRACAWSRRILGRPCITLCDRKPGGGAARILQPCVYDIAPLCHHKAKFFGTAAHIVFF
jgi:hypothetical protein